MTLVEALNRIAGGEDLTLNETKSVFDTIMEGVATPAQIAGILMALNTKGETAPEVAGAAMAMREASRKVDIHVPHLIDVCGTGGSGSKKLFNVSTAAAMVAAAGGAHVAKHGNRGASSKSGSADVLEQAGVNLELDPVRVARCIVEVGVGFMFAQRHHPAMRFAGPVRAELGVRTVFNMLGPLTNPANAKRQVIGVYSPRIQYLMAEVLHELGSEHVLVVHADGLDEIQLNGRTKAVELRDGQINEIEIDPREFGIEPQDAEGLHADSPQASLALIESSLREGDNPAASNLVALNAGAALYVSGVATSLANGVALAQDVISTGQAREKFKELVDFTNIDA